MGRLDFDMIILFDGVCNFCDKSVQFIIKRDPMARFKFASLQSDAGKDLLKLFNVPKDINSIVLIKNNKAYFKSSAVLNVCKNLKRGWKFLYLLMIVPRPFRDFLYEIMAKNRYKWFGKTESCMIPSPDIRKRFL